MHAGSYRIIQGNGLKDDVNQGYVVAFEKAGMIHTFDHNGQGGFGFSISPYGFQIYEDLKLHAGKPTAQIEEDVRSYLDSEEFARKYATASQLWRDAAELLWQANSTRNFSLIGHKCREAIQEFVTRLLERLSITDANSHKAMTRARFSAVLDARREALGEARSELLDALFNYWRAAGDVIQRQEHAGQREGEPLVWEDGRRVVFQTAILMYEVDRTLFGST